MIYEMFHILNGGFECSTNCMFVTKILTLPKEGKRHLFLHHSLFKWEKTFLVTYIKKGYMFNTPNNRGSFNCPT